jgi:hypothetical protein
MVYPPIHPFSQFISPFLLDLLVQIMYIFDSNTVLHYDCIDTYEQTLTLTSIHSPLSYI